jgi:flavin reductase (DIM6/NTAB) family NADH-FMN oxidoreductase RutF
MDGRDSFFRLQQNQNMEATMERKTINTEDLLVRSHHLWATQWMLLTAGDFAAGHYNTMTVGWGSLGTMWGKPFAQVVVRPGRYTLEFLEQYDTFTLCAFPEQYRDALQLLGSCSGRDHDKIVESGLTPEASAAVAAPCFAEAELVVECRKMYWQDMDSQNFLDPAIAKNYPQKDYHRIYFGEIVAVSGTKSFQC